MLAKQDLQNYTGQLITIEGVDTAGKSTQAELLAKELEKQGRTVIRLHFPVYERPIGNFIQELLSVNSDSEEDAVSMDAMQMLFVADQMAYQEELLRYLQQGFTVLLDRYDLSTLAYYAAKEGMAESLYTVYGRWQTKLLKPDLTIILTLPAEEVAKRKGELDRFERDEPFLDLVRESYEWLAGNMNDRHTLLINAMGTVEEVQQAILEKTITLIRGEQKWV